MDSPVIQTAIGLVFIFAVFAGLVAMVTEGIARFFGLRGEYLLRGIRSLVDSDNNFSLRKWGQFFGDTVVTYKKKGDAKALVTQLLEHPLIAGSSASGVPEGAGDVRLNRRQRKKLPSYVSSRSFASALLAIVVPDAHGKATIPALKAKLDTDDYKHLKKALLPLLNQADEDIEKFRTSLEQWYDDQMARVSGWYKRHVRWISLGLAVAFAVVFNLNAIEIARTLYSDDAVRAQVVEQAEKSTPCTEGDSADCVAAVRQAASAGIPIGWTKVDGCALDTAECGLLEERGIVRIDDEGWEQVLTIVLLLLGFALMAAATVPGSRFWFDSLSKLGSLRSTGPKPDTSTGT